MAYIFIDKKVYRQNKKQIDEFINQDEHIAKFTFKKNSDMRWVVKIHVQFLHLLHFLSFKFLLDIYILHTHNPTAVLWLWKDYNNIYILQY
jgi:hypothetical protein